MLPRGVRTESKPPPGGFGFAAGAWNLSCRSPRGGGHDEGEQATMAFQVSDDPLVRVDITRTKDQEFTASVPDAGPT
jgi:hypothetical protein